MLYRSLSSIQPYGVVSAHSVRIPRGPTYSGYRHAVSPFAYGTVTLYGLLSQNSSARITESIMRSEPRNARTPVWPLSLSLAATHKIDVSFSSSGYLDVSVHRVPFMTLWIHVMMARSLVPGFPIQISTDHGLFAANRGFSQLITSFVGS